MPKSLHVAPSTNVSVDLGWAGRTYMGVLVGHDCSVKGGLRKERKKIALLTTHPFTSRLPKNNHMSNTRARRLAEWTSICDTSQPCLEEACSAASTWAQLRKNDASYIRMFVKIVFKAKPRLLKWVIIPDVTKLIQSHRETLDCFHRLCNPLHYQNPDFDMCFLKVH